MVLLGATLVDGALAGVLAAAGAAAAVAWVLASFAVAVAAWRLVRMIADLRDRRWGVDVLAVLAVGSTVVVGEFWAAWVITVMMTGGDALEAYASHRAHGEIQAMLERAPRTALRLPPADAPDAPPVEIEVAAIAIGDVLLIRPGDVVPVDADVVDARGAFDLSAITGESLPETRRAGERVPSGAVATTAPVRVRCAVVAEASEYQRIVRAVEAAAGSRSGFVRLADRIAVPFTGVSLAIAGIAWAVSGSFLRFAEVLVVATPCSLLIAAPAAFVAGMGRTARAGVVMKNAAALERLASVRAAAFDKTGTLTGGSPSVSRVEVEAGSDEAAVLGEAAAAESASSHALAAAVVAAAREHAVAMPALSGVEEHPGEGMSARLDGQELRVGAAAFTGAEPRPAAGEAIVHVAVGGRERGRIVLRDPIRPDAREVIAALRADGVERIAMVTGDDVGTARTVAAEAGIEEVHAALSPQDKARIVAALSPRPAMMVGDGINDVLVLASADIGVAMNRSGLGAAGESADAVILTGRLDALLAARRIAFRTRRIARQSVWLGAGISVALMLVATTGVLPPILGAVAQEAVDVLTILNALRATRAGRS